MTCQSPLTVILYESLHCLSQQKFFDRSYVKQYFQNTSRGAKKADEMIRQASFCSFRSFLTRYCLLRLSTPDTHPYDMIECCIYLFHSCVYLFHHSGFISHVLSTICLYCINTVVALWPIRVICRFQVSLLSRLTPNSFAFMKSSSFGPFNDKEPKFKFCL